MSIAREPFGEIAGTAVEALTLTSASGVRAPLIGLNVQPGHAPWAVPYLQRARIGHVRASWWHWSTPQEWSWMSDFRGKVTSAWCTSGLCMEFESSKAGWETQRARV